MGQTGHGQIGIKLKEVGCNSADYVASKESNVSTYLIEFITKNL